MGMFSGKEKMRITSLAADLAESVMTSAHNVNNIFKGETIGKVQQLEWLIFNMFAVTKAVQASFDSALSENVLNHFHLFVYQACYDSEHDRQRFERIVGQRYDSYFSIVVDTPDMPVKLGTFFREKFMPNGHPAIAVVSVDIFANKIAALRKYFGEVIEKYDLE